jgi:hypothetical protein
MALKSLKDFGFDGKAVLRIVIEASEYRSIPQAVAALTLFSNPITVGQTNNENLFRVIRCRSMSDRGKPELLVDGSRGMLDDNTAPTDAFIWANGISRSAYQDVQFNHVWSSNDVSMYTSLANICMTPAFLAKLTDTDGNVRELLRFRAFDLFNGFALIGNQPTMPQGYKDLIWAEPLPPVYDLEKRVRAEMIRKPKSRTVKSARELGWFFSSFMPDTTIKSSHPSRCTLDY